MNRRELFKRGILAIPIAVIGSKTATGESKVADEGTSGTSSEGPFCWIEAINPDPETWNWSSSTQFLIGVDANKQSAGDTIVTRTGQRYECWPVNSIISL